ncbi:MAG: hypothetical protein V3U60_16535 [Gammaproteobacteria bacterium]
MSAAVNGRDGLDPRKFHNALRILRSIDLHELTDAAVIAMGDGDSWARFRADPYTWAIRAEDAQFEALFSIIEKRMS